ncbi:MAG: aspartate-semialdehyde dehydrogenase [Bacilli bacterium]|jgi:aspartate-semialdehyde dehydrogenase
MKKYNVALVGATGLVGSTFIKILQEKNFPVKNLKLLASANSAGKQIECFGKMWTVEELKEDSFKDVDIALFSAGGSISQKFAPIAAKAGATVIDNSSAWRMDKNVPLVVPEVNFDSIKDAKLIANPNCSTIQVILPLAALKQKYGLKKVNFATYQSVSGSGMKGINDLLVTRKGEKNTFYPYPIVDTCIPQIDVFLENGYTKEEMKMVDETRKILNLPDLKVSATCIRVPVLSCHGVSIQVELEKDFKVEDVKELMKNFPGIVLADDPSNAVYPVSTIATNTDNVYVGRIRRDLSTEKGLLLYTVADNIRKGAASNAVQIAEKIIASK